MWTYRTESQRSLTSSYLFQRDTQCSVFEESKNGCKRLVVLHTTLFFSCLAIKFHSDSERGLGPLVASLSLGSPALMHFRHKSTQGTALTLILRHVRTSNTSSSQDLC